MRRKPVQIWIVMILALTTWRKRVLSIASRWGMGMCIGWMVITMGWRVRVYRE